MQKVHVSSPSPKRDAADPCIPAALLKHKRWNQQTQPTPLTYPLQHHCKVNDGLRSASVDDRQNSTLTRATGIDSDGHVKRAWLTLFVCASARHSTGSESWVHRSMRNSSTLCATAQWLLFRQLRKSSALRQLGAAKSWVCAEAAVVGSAGGTQGTTALRAVVVVYCPVGRQDG